MRWNPDTGSAKDTLVVVEVFVFVALKQQKNNLMKFPRTMLEGRKDP